MPDVLPIACSLDRDAFRERGAVIAQLGRDGLLRAELTAGHARLEFRETVGDRLGDLVAAEQQCCAFLTFRVAQGEHVVVLEIEGPEDAAPILADFVDAFSVAAAPTVPDAAA
jgi:MerR family copper efflux transcriptional regulator